jgi:DNA-binding IclR family transcriptional regulator
MSGHGARGAEGGWTFVTNHLLVLLCIFEDHDTRMTDVAARLDITERAVQRIVAELVEAGYLTRTRVGRRNSYRVNRSMPMRHLETQHRRLGEFLDLLGREST